jgi:hypothetical protein
MLSLYQAMDRMKKRGFDAVARCAGATLKVKANTSTVTLITAFAMALFL